MGMLSLKPYFHMSQVAPLLNTRELKLFPVQSLKVNLLLLLLMQAIMVMVTPTGAERNVPLKLRLILKLIMGITVMVDIVDTTDIDMVDTTDIPMDTDTVMDGANKQVKAKCKCK